jgi:hypothetical protein
MGCHRLRIPQGLDLLFLEPSPVTTHLPGRQSYDPISDPHFCATPPIRLEYSRRASLKAGKTRERSAARRTENERSVLRVTLYKKSSVPTCLV